MKFVAMETEVAEAFREGRPDANGHPPEKLISDGGGYPCRHCLNDIAAGRNMLLIAWRPFIQPQPYAETGPVFLCEDACERFEGGDMPPVLAKRPAALIRGYDRNERIIDGTGGQVSVEDLKERLKDLFSRDEVFQCPPAFCNEQLLHLQGGSLTYRSVAKSRYRLGDIPNAMSSWLIGSPDCLLF